MRTFFGLGGSEADGEAQRRRDASRKRNKRGRKKEVFTGKGRLFPGEGAFFPGELTAKAVATPPYWA